MVLSVVVAVVAVVAVENNRIAVVGKTIELWWRWWWKTIEFGRWWW